MTGLKPDCFRCKHLIGVGAAGWQCDAFDAIPVDVLSRRVRHVEDIEGDRGIRFEARGTQEQASYEPVSTHRPERCLRCTHFREPDGCRIVEGPISPEGWCPGFKMRQDDIEAAVRSDAQGSSQHDLDDQPLRAAGVMICTKGGKVLMLRRSDSGQWAFPGGRIEDGETPEQAALRECEEEIGIRPDIHSEWTRRSAEGVDFTTFFSLVPEEFDPVLNEEHTEFQWLPVDDLASDSRRSLGLG